MVFGYDGRDFSGYQRQLEARTVQGEIEQVLSLLFASPVTLHSSGRTDTGVHAIGQVASFETKLSIDVPSLTRALHRMLPRDIKLKKLVACPETFHPRFDAIGKHYRYICSREDRLFERPYVHFLKETPDLEKMREAIAFLTGVHSFASFSNRRKGERDLRRDLWAIEIHEKQEKILFDLYADGFLYRMARVLIQYLLHVGWGKISPQRTPDILASESRTYTRLLAPPHALYLMHVYYPYDVFA